VWLVRLRLRLRIGVRMVMMVVVMGRLSARLGITTTAARRWVCKHGN
jgi:hypothetical protein